MFNSYKRNILAITIAIAAAVAELVTFAVLIGKHEADSYTVYVVAGFLSAEPVTFCLMLLSAFKARKLRAEEAYEPPDPYAFRRFALLLAAYVVGAGVVYLGKFVQSYLQISAIPALIAVLAVCGSLLLLFLVGNPIAMKVVVNKLESKKVPELIDYVAEHRTFAEERSTEKLASSKKWKLSSEIYSAFVFLLAVGMAFSAGALLKSTPYFPLVALAPAYFFHCAFSRIRFPLPVGKYYENRSFVAESEYPELYAIARKAAAAINNTDKFRICLGEDMNASVEKIKDVINIQLGAMLLSVMTQEEVYCVLLHEYAHMTGESILLTPTEKYNQWLEGDGTPHYFERFTDAMFCFFDAMFTFDYAMYSYAASVLNETNADRAMAQFGDRAAAASALVKLHHHAMFMWEYMNGDEECVYAKEKPDKLYLHREIERFTCAIEARAEAWSELAEKEIISRKASHPTLAMRLKTLGADGCGISKTQDGESYRKECVKALDYTENVICDRVMTDYAAARKDAYLDPLSKVEEWEKAGKPIVATEYSDVIGALYQLGRYSEIPELCNRAIDALPQAASVDALYNKGVLLLHAWDPAGMDCVYEAIENNSNYAADGFELIGTFCLLTGRQKELDECRQKSAELAQRDKDEFSRINELEKGDDISAERLPDELLKGVVDFVGSVDDGSIDSVYVLRKTVSETFFVSDVIVRFKKDTVGIKTDEIMHKLFRYLDTCSDWQFSLFYYENVKKVKPEKYEGSLIYGK